MVRTSTMSVERREKATRLIAAAGSPWDRITRVVAESIEMPA
jgi:hypothetical protein